MHIIKIIIVTNQPSLRIAAQAVSKDTALENLEILEYDPGDDSNYIISEIMANSPNIVLLDIGYPTVDGLKLGKKIARTSPIDVIVLSTNPGETDDELFAAARSGAVAYLNIDQFACAELINVLKRVCNRERPIVDRVSNNSEVARRIIKQFQNSAALPGIMEVEAFSLSEEEMQVLQLIAGRNHKEQILSVLRITEPTLMERVKAILGKLNEIDRASDIFTKSRRDLLSIQIARNGNLFIFDSPSDSRQPQPLCDSIPQL